MEMRRSKRNVAERFGDGVNSSPLKKRCQRKQSVTLREVDVIERWTRVREENNFLADDDVAGFLLSWYLDGGATESKSKTRCCHCHTPLILYCQTCQLPGTTSDMSSVPNTTGTSAFPSCGANNLFPTVVISAVDSEIAKRETAVDGETGMNVNDFTNDGDVLDGDNDDGDVDNDEEELPSQHCSVCDKTLTGLSASEFSKHVKRHRAGVKRKRKKDVSEEGSANIYICPHCKGVARGRGLHLSHLKIHKDLFCVEENHQYKCKYCVAEFQSLKQLCRHVAMPAGKDVCSECGQELPTNCEANKHRRQHRLEQRRYCAWCQKSLASATYQQFYNHVKRHKDKDEKGGTVQEVKPGVVCAICGKLYPSKHGLKDHMRRMHSTECPYVCDFPGCDRKFKMRNDLTQHSVMHGERKEVCEVCGKKYRRKKELKLHMQVHYGKNYPCETCHRRFQSSYHLKMHVNTVHKAIRSFVCGVCDKRLVTKTSLTTHMRMVHSDSRPFPCAQCNAAFKGKQALAKHMLGHSNSKPYQCADCGMCYRDHCSYAAHRKSKHKDSVYSCSVCGADFHVLQSLRFHMKMYHNEVPLDEVKQLPSSVQPCENDQNGEHGTAVGVSLTFNLPVEFQQNSVGLD